MATGAHHVLSAVEPNEIKPSTNGVHTNGTNGVNGVKKAHDLGDFAIDEYRPMRIAVIGAGFSGIIAGIRFPQHVPNVEMTIYEKNAGIGGTWFSNKYPGLACDIPSHCYQLTFEVNTQWSSFYAPRNEILAYLQRVVDKYKLQRHIRLEHELVHARYESETGKWHLKIRRPLASAPPEDPQFEVIDDVVDFVFTGTGGLSRWSMPDIPGLKDFKGLLLHSAKWDLPGETWQETVKDWGDRKVGVIGVGSSALQIVPALQPVVARLTNYVRGQTWLAVPFASHKLADLLDREAAVPNYAFTDGDRKKFEDPEYYRKFRHELESDLNSTHSATLRGTKMQIAGVGLFKENMLKKLETKPWIADHIIPNFPVACRRLTPGPGYLEALCQDNVDFVPQSVTKITETGIETADGEHRELDVIICATGYDTSYQYPFPVVGRGGKTLQDRWSPHPETYLSVCQDGYPNWFQALGPNSGVGSGSLLVLMERQVDYAVKVVQKMQRERLKSVEVKAAAVRAFDEYLESYFPKTVYSEKCRSWYKMGKEEGRVVGLWPGSCLHAVRALTHPRWEDFNYESLDNGKHSMYWLGDGYTYNEKYMTGNCAWYLNDEEVDIPPVPE